MRYVLMCVCVCARARTWEKDDKGGERKRGQTRRVTAGGGGGGGVTSGAFVAESVFSTSVLSAVVFECVCMLQGLVFRV
jgi:hypothetical protein